jgi:hypothetical protein
MTAVSWRAEDSLVERVRKVASTQGKSMNEFITQVLDAATNPESASDEATRIRERLARFDLVVPQVDAELRVRPPADLVEKARKAAGQGTLLSDLVIEGRG